MTEQKSKKKKYILKEDKKTVRLSTVKGSFNLSEELPQYKLKIIYQLLGDKFVTYE
tara:strand:- start:767 stop:934 length:168 start_codon:yes stop_codon:yes gene_type:complete